MCDHLLVVGYLIPRRECRDPPGDLTVCCCPPGSFFRAFGAPRVDFPWFLVALEPHRKIKFFRLLQKSIKTKNKSILGAPGLHFVLFFITLGSYFGIDFSLFFWMTSNQEKCLFFNTFQWFWTIKNHWFSYSFSFFFMFFQNRYPGLFLEGPSAELFEQIGFWCHFRFSWFSKRHPLNTIFGLKGSKLYWGIVPDTFFSRPCFSRNHSNPRAVGT